MKAGGKKAVPRRPSAALALPHAFDLKAYKGLKAGILGLGRSGLAAAKLLSRKGFRVFASDSRPRKEMRAAAAALPAAAAWEVGEHSDKLLSCGFVVKSPGIPGHAPIIARLRENGIPVFSEIEVALALAAPVRVVAVTGSNGKTTTSALTAAAFKAAKRRVHLLGNIGEPVAAAASKMRKGDTVVLEVSSYQLEDSRSFLPHAAAVLNVTSDHLDHHGSLAAYREAKARIFRRQGRSEVCVFNADDPGSLALSRECRARSLFFSRAPAARSSAWIEDGKIRLRLPGEKKPCSVKAPPILGEHNLQNAMAAAILARAEGIKPGAISKAFGAFRGVEHRIEELGRRGPLFCVNDSKATNVDSTIAALRALKPRAGTIFLILGGLAKPGGFKGLRPHLEGMVKAVLSIGSASPTIEEDLQGITSVFPCQTLEQAVTVAYQIASKGDCLLLSPACASFDQFQNFEHRGDVFKSLVAKRARR